MTDQDYVEFCNFAYGLRRQAESFFAQMNDEHLYQLDGLVRSELAASSGGTVEEAYDFLAAILAQEVTDRRNPLRNVVPMPRRSGNGLPF